MPSPAAMFHCLMKLLRSEKHRHSPLSNTQYTYFVSSIKSLKMVISVRNAVWKACTVAYNSLHFRHTLFIMIDIISNTVLSCWMLSEAYQEFCVDFLRHFEAWLFFRFSKKDETMPLKNNIFLTVNNKYNTRKWSLNQIDCFCSQFITVWCS